MRFEQRKKYGTVYNIKVRNKEYEVLLIDDGTNASIEFRYVDGCIVTRDIFIREDMSPEKLYSYISTCVKYAIYDYNQEKNSRKTKNKNRS